MYEFIVLLVNMGTLILFTLIAHQTLTSKVVHRNLMNCMGIFGIPIFVTVAVHIPV